MHSLAACLRFVLGLVTVVYVPLLLLLAPAEVRGQGLQVHGGYSGAVLSTSEWSPGHGPYIGVTLGQWLGLGLRIEYRSQVRDAGEIRGFRPGGNCKRGPVHEEKKGGGIAQLGIKRNFIWRTESPTETTILSFI